MIVVLGLANCGWSNPFMVSGQVPCAHEILSVVRRFFEGVSADGVSVELCRRIDHDMRLVLSEGPTFLRPGTDISSFPVWVASARRYFIVSVHHKILLLHRSMVANPSFSETNRTLARTAMVESAHQILHHFNDNSQPFQQVWIYNFSPFGQNRLNICCRCI